MDGTHGRHGRSVITTKTLRKAFKYGFEYETLIHGKSLIDEYNKLKVKGKELIDAFAEAEREGVIDHDDPYTNEGAYKTVYDCDSSLYSQNDMARAEFKDTPHFPYREGLYNLLKDTLWIEYAPTFGFMSCPSETKNSLRFKKLKQSFSDSWKITYDGSVTKHKSAQVDHNIPVYKTLADLETGACGPKLISLQDPNLVECFELVSPPLDRKYIFKGGFAETLNQQLTANGLTYYNNVMTSNHIHLSCNYGGVNYLETPATLYHIYKMWMIFEPIILLTLPFWRRDNTRYASSIFAAINKSGISGIGSTSVDRYTALLDWDMNKLFNSIYPYRITRSTRKKYAITSTSTSTSTSTGGGPKRKPESSPNEYSYTDFLIDEEKISEDDVKNQTDRLKIIKIISIFQGFVGRENVATGFKSNSARYAGLNALNLLNPNKKSHTVEVRLKHGSSDPRETIKYIDMFTELFLASRVLQMKGQESDALFKKLLSATTKLGEKIYNDSDLSAYTSSSPLESQIPELKELLDELRPLVPEHTFHFIVDQISLVNKFKKTITLPLKETNGQSAQSAQSAQSVVESTQTAQTAQTAKSTTVGMRVRAHTTRAPVPAPAPVPVHQAQEMDGGGGPRDNKWVFCYGSNSLDQLRERVKHRGAWNFKPVVLKNWVRIFCGYSKTWDGGVASIHEKGGSDVFGIIVEMNRAERKRLDVYEGVGKSGWYYHENIRVETIIGNEKIDAIAYVKEDLIYDEPPSIEYLEAISLTLHNAANAANAANATLKSTEIKALTRKILGKGIPIYGFSEMLKLKKYGFWTFDAETIALKK